MLTIDNFIKHVLIWQKEYFVYRTLTFRMPTFKNTKYFYIGKKLKHTKYLTPFFVTKWTFLRARYALLPDSFYLFFSWKFWLNNNKIWNIKARLIYSYKVWPWTFIKFRQDVAPQQYAYTKFFFDKDTNLIADNRLQAINVKHKIKINVKQMRGLIRRIFFLNNKNNTLNYFIVNLLKNANKRKQSATTTLNYSQFSLLYYFLGLSNANIWKFNKMINFKKIVRMPISKYTYVSVRSNWNRILKIRKQIYKFNIPNFLYYRYTLRTHEATRRLWFFKYIFLTYDLPKGLEIDLLTMSVVQLNFSNTASYVWYGFIAHTWWAFFNFYNWKFFY